MLSNASIDRRSASTSSGRALALIWIDAREALVVRAADGPPTVHRVASDVPAHHRATGHVRHEPAIRHGGGGVPQTAGEPRRLEHLARFLERVAAAVAPDEDLLIVGPGTVHERLARTMGRLDAEHRIARTIAAERAGPMTRRQLTACLRRAMGEEPRRRTVGAYRWTRAGEEDASGGRAVTGRCIGSKRTSGRDRTRLDRVSER